jgi:hypothetical protein
LSHEPVPFGPRTDQAHVAAQHIPQLRQFVDPGGTQEPADARDPRIAGVRVGIVVRSLRAHGAKFDDFERHVVFPDAPLAEENGTAILQPDGHRAADDKRRKHDEPGHGEPEIADSFQPLEHRFPRDLKTFLKEPGLVEPVERYFPPIQLMEQFESVGGTPPK